MLQIKEIVELYTKNKKTKIDFKVVELNLKKQKAPKQERANQMKEREERK